MSADLQGSMIDPPTAFFEPAPRIGAIRSFTNHPVLRFVVRRLIGLVFVIVLLAILVFFMVQLVPGDPIKGAFGDNITQSQVNALRHQYGLDTSVLHQLGTYLKGLVHGDLGSSYQTQEPVRDIVTQRISTSLQLAGAALALVLAIGVTIGVIVGSLTREGRHRKLELVFTSVTSVFAAIPDYLLGTVLVFLFAVQLRLLPVAGSGSFATLVLPAIAVALAPTMTLARIVRVETLNVLAQDYIRTARSKRLPVLRIYARHVIPNVLTASLTIAGLLFASIIGGAVIVENVFGRAGLGSALVEAVLSKNYPVVQGIALILGVTVVVMNALVDLLLVALDPRSEMRQS